MFSCDVARGKGEETTFASPESPDGFAALTRQIYKTQPVVANKSLVIINHKRKHASIGRGDEGGLGLPNARFYQQTQFFQPFAPTERRARGRC
jgi:hypothetical protein